MTAKRQPTLLSVRSLHMTFAARGTRVRALDDVSLDLDRGEVVALVGESGSGKSTVARIVAGTLAPDSGEVIFDGHTVRRRRRQPLAYRKRVQMIFQDPFGSLNPAHTLGHHLERPLCIHGLASSRRDARTRAADLLERVGLSPGPAMAAKHPHEVSGGQRQRVAIARAIATAPDLILADEPTSMLDVSLRADVLNLLRGLQRERGCSFLYITHDLASARYFADRIVVMHRGRVVEEGPAADVLDAPREAYTRTLLDAVARLSA